MDVVERQEIETVFTANLKQLESALIRYGNSIESAAARQEKAFRKSNANIGRSAERLNSQLRNAIAVGAIAVAGKEILDYEEAWRNTTNTLHQYRGVLGLAATAAKDLNAVANDAGVPLSGLTSLTGAAARAAGTMGDKLGDARSAVFDFAETVSKGAALANNGVAAVDGALIQLSQAIASPRVQLGEFNSIVEGTPRLAQAFADGIDKAGGSVSKLRLLIGKGDISGEELFKGLLSQTEKVRAEFESLNQGPSEALARLQNRITEFVGTNEAAVSSAQKLAGAINFVADNLGPLTDAIIVGSAALGGFLGASALAAITTGLGGMTKGLTGAAKAMALLNGVTKLFGGPFVIAVTAAAAALAYFALKGDGAAAAIDKLEDTLGAYNRTQGRIESDTSALTQLQRELTEAIKNQQGAIEATKRADIAALTARISKNRELLEIQGLQARAELGRVSESVGNFSGTTVRERTSLSIKDQESERLSILATRKARAEGDASAEGRQAAFLKLLEQQVSKNKAIEAAGGILSKQQRAAYEIKAEYLTLLDRERLLTEQVAALGNTRLAANTDFRDELGQGDYVKPGTKFATPDEDDGKKKKEKDDTLGALAEIRKAYEQTFKTERQLLDATNASRLEAIEKAKVSDAERAELRLQAEMVYSDAVGQIKAAEDAEAEAYAKDRADRAKDQADAEIALLDEVLYYRDAAAGRTLALLDREYEARKAQIEAEIDDQARRNEALAALAETHERTVAEVRAMALEDARDFYETDALDIETDRIARDAEARIEAIQAAYGGEIEAHQEAQNAILAIVAEANDQMIGLQRERLVGYVDDVGSIFSSLGGIIEEYGGKQSGAYKAVMAIERAFTFASLSMQIAQGIGKAIAVGFPQNIPIIAAVTAQGASALAMLSGAKGFQGGGPTGAGADTDVRGVVHANEYVQDAPTVRHYGTDVMRAIQLRRIPKHVLQGYQRGGFVGILPPSISRAADRVTGEASRAFTQVNQSSSSISYKAGDVNLYGRDDNDIVRQLRAELRASEARVSESILPTIAADVRRGGGAVASVIEGTYGLNRTGR